MPRLNYLVPEYYYLVDEPDDDDDELLELLNTGASTEIKKKCLIILRRPEKEPNALASALLQYADALAATRQKNVGLNSNECLVLRCAYEQEKKTSSKSQLKLLRLRLVTEALSVVDSTRFLGQPGTVKEFERYHAAVNNLHRIVAEIEAILKESPDETAAVLRLAALFPAEANVTAYSVIDAYRLFTAHLCKLYLEKLVLFHAHQKSGRYEGYEGKSLDEVARVSEYLPEQVKQMKKETFRAAELCAKFPANCRGVDLSSVAACDSTKVLLLEQEFLSLKNYAWSDTEALESNGREGKRRKPEVSPDDAGAAGPTPTATSPGSESSAAASSASPVFPSMARLVSDARTAALMPHPLLAGLGEKEYEMIKQIMNHAHAAGIDMKTVAGKVTTFFQRLRQPVPSSKITTIFFETLAESPVGCVYHQAILAYLVQAASLRTDDVRNVTVNLSDWAMRVRAMMPEGVAPAQRADLYAETQRVLQKICDAGTVEHRSSPGPVRF